MFSTKTARNLRDRSALSLIEILVVLAIIGILVGMFLPAIQQVRSAARRVACANQLHQIGIALHNHHASHQAFPAGCTEFRLGNDRAKKQLAWSAFLLPYLDQHPVFDQLDFNSAFDSAANATPAAAILPVFVCPSSLRDPSPTHQRGPCDYGGIYGERISSPNNPPKGTMIHDRAIALRDITDGSSNTLIVAEDTGWPDGQWINGRNVFDQAFPINQAPFFENDIRSHHPNGANVVRCDGSVDFLAEHTDLDFLAAVCTRAGGEIVPDK